LLAVFAFSGSISVVWKGCDIYSRVIFTVCSPNGLNEEASRREVERRSKTHVATYTSGLCIQAEDLATEKKETGWREDSRRLGHLPDNHQMQIEAAQAVSARTRSVPTT